jgi:hypothetical protein
VSLRVPGSVQDGEMLDRLEALLDQARAQGALEADAFLVE